MTQFPVPDPPSAPMPYGVQNAAARAKTAREIRVKAAEFEHMQPLPSHNDNGDENLYDKKYGSYSKGLPHDEFGVVDHAAYKSLHKAVSTGKPQDFQHILLGGNIKLVNPQAGLAFDLLGADSHALSIPPSPAVASAERAAEMVELYWMALCRDIPFCDYATEATVPTSPIAKAIKDLNSLPAFTGPKDQVTGLVTAQTLFRGDTPGELDGPYISQFFTQTAGFGDLSATLDSKGEGQLYYAYQPGLNFMIDAGRWLAVQNGQSPSNPPPANNQFGANTYVTDGSGDVKDICGAVVSFGGKRIPFYLYNGRMGSAFVHVDELYQAYFMAALNLLDSLKPNSYDVNNPYQVPNLPGSATEAGFGTFGNPHVATLVAEVATRALKAQWYQKWFVHRTLRPEAYAGMVHFAKTGSGTNTFPLHPSVLNSPVLNEIKNLVNPMPAGNTTPSGTYFLPMAFPEGSPQHPSYGSGHATVAGACATIIKAFFNEDKQIDCPVQISSDGNSVTKYTGPPLTIKGEANKIAGNVGMFRNHAGVHWRSDHVQSILLGEKIAISILQDQKYLYNEPFAGWNFTAFDGTPVAI